MTYSGDLIKLNGKSYKCITGYKVGRNKLWGSDTGRALSGDFKGTLIGNFPKIMLEIEPLDGEEMAELEEILDSSSIVVEYYNLKRKGIYRGNFYSNDYEEDWNLALFPTVKTKTFTVNLISEKKEDKHVRVN